MLGRSRWPTLDHGHGIVHVRVEPEHRSDANLTADFSTDQTFIAATLRQLNTIAVEQI
jgi:hypothetical protein